MRHGTAQTLAALLFPADAVLITSSSQPRGLTEAAAKERDAGPSVLVHRRAGEWSRHGAALSL
jgi:hypothetical protein